MNKLDIEIGSIKELLLKIQFLKTLQRLGILNRFETISMEDGAWDMKQ